MKVSLHSEKPESGKETEISYKGYSAQNSPIHIAVDINSNGSKYNITFENSMQIVFPIVKESSCLRCISNHGINVTHFMIGDNVNSLIIPLDIPKTIFSGDEPFILKGELNIEMEFNNTESDITKAANKFIKKLFNAVQKNKP